MECQAVQRLDTPLVLTAGSPNSGVAARAVNVGIAPAHAQLAGMQASLSSTPRDSPRTELIRIGALHGETGSESTETHKISILKTRCRRPFQFTTNDKLNSIRVLFLISGARHETQSADRLQMRLAAPWKSPGFPCVVSEPVGDPPTGLIRTWLSIYKNKKGCGSVRVISRCEH